MHDRFDDSQYYAGIEFSIFYYLIHKIAIFHEFHNDDIFSCNFVIVKCYYLLRSVLHWWKYSFVIERLHQLALLAKHLICFLMRLVVNFDGKNLWIFISDSIYPWLWEVIPCLATDGNLFIDLELSNRTGIHLCPKI